MRLVAAGALLIVGSVASIGFAQSQNSPAAPSRNVPAELTVLIPGHDVGDLLVDATNGKLMFPAPASPRRFESWDAFYQFARHDLNAVLYTDGNGAPIGVGGKVGRENSIYLVDSARETVISAPDAIVAYVGGIFGYFYVGDQLICLDPKLCGGLMSPASTGDQVVASLGNNTIFCNQNSTYCALATSFVTNYVVYRTSGSATGQGVGGYHTASYFCWKNGWIPWVCYVGYGTNALSVSALYKQDTIPLYSDQHSAGNVESIEARNWYIGNGCSPMAYACKTNTVCGHHTGNSGAIFVSGNTADGRFPSSCQ